MFLMAIASLLSVAQITLGGVVRVTGSGDGCPDWPLCFGSIVPPWNDMNAILEWSHRVSGSAVGVFILLGTVRAWVGPVGKRVAWLATGSLILVAIVGGLGGGVVLNDLNPTLRTIHLMLAEITVLGVILVTVAAAKNGEATLFKGGGSEVAVWLIWGSALVLLALLIGSYTVLRGAGQACPSWPLCTGLEFPRSSLEVIHISHRVISLVAVLVAAFAVHKAIRLPNGGAIWKGLAWLTLLVIAAQVLIGAANPWTLFDAWARAAHLSLATIGWALLCLMAAVEWKRHAGRSSSLTDGSSL